MEKGPWLTDKKELRTTWHYIPCLLPCRLRLQLRSYPSPSPCAPLLSTSDCPLVFCHNSVSCLPPPAPHQRDQLSSCAIQPLQYRAHLGADFPVYFRNLLTNVSLLLLQLISLSGCRLSIFLSACHSISESISHSISSSFILSRANSDSPVSTTLSEGNVLAPSEHREHLHPP